MTVNWRKILITGGGLGLLKPAPGSWGTAGAAAIYWVLVWGQWVSMPVVWVVLLVGALGASWLLVKLAPGAMRDFGDEDPGQVVLDEYAGFWLTVAWVPVVQIPGIESAGLSLFVFTSGLYILFRFFDTLKVPPGRQLERLPAGWGILCDDLSAGLQANLVAQIIVRCWFMG